MNLFLLDIIEDTVVDGPGFRTSLYAAGCRNLQLDDCTWGIIPNPGNVSMGMRSE